MDYTKIKLRREALHMTQTTLAAMAGITVRALSSIEHGHATPRRSTLELLSEALYPGEPQKFLDLISPPPDYASMIAELDASSAIPSVAKPALRRLLDTEDPDGISYCLGTISGLFPHLQKHNYDFGPYIAPYCHALLSSTSLSPYLDEHESMWQSITATLSQLGDPAQDALDKMQATHRSPNFSAKLEALKAAVATAETLYLVNNNRSHCLSILQLASIIMGGAQLSDPARVELYGCLCEFSASFEAVQNRALSNALRGSGECS